MSLTATNFSHVGAAALSLLNANFAEYESRLWDVTSGKIIGDLQYTPLDFWNSPQMLPEGHSDWFAERLGDLLGKTTQYCDLMSLAPPDGFFLEEMRKGLATIANRATNENPVVIRMMFGDFVPTAPLNVTGVLHDLVDGILTEATNVDLWVGAWRNGISWNHAKLIAIDGKYLHTGGHNLWTSDYLEEAPVHDLSFELEGDVTHGAHYFANQQWEHLEQNLGVVFVSAIAQFFPASWQKYVAFMPDELLQLLPALNNGFVAKYPPGASSFPPMYARTDQMGMAESVASAVPMISMGKLGTILDDEPSEEAFVAMFDSSTDNIKLAIQDVGPRKICRDQPVPLPGFSWPDNHLSAFGRALARGVDVEMILSNFGAFDLGGYSNGWTCNDVAAQILRTIPTQFPEYYNNNTVDDGINKTMLTNLASQHLRIGFLRSKFGNQYSNGNDIALHTKHFIIDDVAAYIGSENIYAFDLAEWGILVDDPLETSKMINQLWIPMYNYSYTGEDCDLPFVVENLLEVPEPTIQEDFLSIFDCFGIDLESVLANQSTAVLLDVVSNLVPNNAQGGFVVETSAPSSSPSTAFPTVIAEPTSGDEDGETSGDGEGDGDSQEDSSEDASDSANISAVTPIVIALLVCLGSLVTLV